MKPKWCTLLLKPHLFTWVWRSWKFCLKRRLSKTDFLKKSTTHMFGSFKQTNPVHIYHRCHISPERQLALPTHSSSLSFLSRRAWSSRTSSCCGCLDFCLLFVAGGRAQLDKAEPFRGGAIQKPRSSPSLQVANGPQPRPVCTVTRFEQRDDVPFFALSARSIMSLSLDPRCVA